MKYIVTLIVALGILSSCITSNNSPSEFDGLSLQEAKKVAEEKNVPFRVIQEDGEEYMVTKDYIPGRINAIIEDGKVKSVEVE